MTGSDLASLHHRLPRKFLSPLLGCLRPSPSPPAKTLLRKRRGVVQRLLGSVGVATMLSAVDEVLKSRVKHVLSMLLYLCIFVLHVHLNQGALTSSDSFDPVARYGWVLTGLLVLQRVLMLSPLLFVAFNCLGTVAFSNFPPPPRLHASPLLSPFLCFRVVTRGLFPDLIRRNLQENMQVCLDAGLQNFIFEVVTDTPIGLAKSLHVREVVVPPSYVTSRGTLYKARALQYCLEEGVNILADDDWIVHLDEETLVSPSAVVGIINFVAEGRHQFGQGTITYSHGRIVNWFTTIVDSVRVGVDMGSLRFCFRVLHRPFFSWKGSFIVASAGAERDVTFDHGPDASVAEDCFFAMAAWSRGHSFGWVEGEMWEQSTFTVADFVRQRQRWLRGILLTAKSSAIPARCRVGVMLMALANLSIPSTVLCILLGGVYPLPLPWAYVLACCFTSSTMHFLLVLGVLKSFSPSRLGCLTYAFLALTCILCLTLSIGLECVSTIAAVIPRNNITFYVVQKEHTSQRSGSVV